MLRWKQATGGHWGLSLHQCCINDTYWDTNVFILFSGHACFQYCGSYFVTWLLTDLAFRLLTCGADSILWQAWRSAWELFNGLPRRQNLYTWTCLLEGHQVATKGNFSVSTVMPTGSCRKYSFSGKICETVLWPKTRQTCDVGRSAYSQTTWEAYFFSLATRFEHLACSKRVSASLRPCSFLSSSVTLAPTSECSGYYGNPTIVCLSALCLALSCA